MDDPAGKLEDEYCPPLDAALFRAIISDFDVTSTEGVVQAREILDQIKDSAAQEDSSTLNVIDNIEGSDTIENSDPYISSGETDVSGLSSEVAALSTNDHETDLNSLDLETKVTLFQECFPDASDFTIRHSLKKCNSDWQRALDELLNITAFSHGLDPDGEKVALKGIDAFADPAHRSHRKMKPSKARKRNTSSQTSSSDYSETYQTTNKWQTSSQDIDFIASRSGLSTALVRSVYYANGASIPNTIVSLLKDLIKSSDGAASNVPSVINTNAAQLAQDFPTVATEYIVAMTKLTHPSTSAAHELARALTRKPTTMTTGPITPQYRPLNLESDNSDNGDQSTYSSQDISHEQARHLASSHRQAHQALSAKAQAAYRLSRSNRLMGGAAAYYADESRSAHGAATAYTSAAADALVASRTTGDGVDLHGVGVVDAVRIARRETVAWWGGLGEARVNGRVGAGERGAGFRIVVGRGTHSEGGKGKLGPAVSKALVSDGWRVDKEEGVLVVHGKVKH